MAQLVERSLPTPEVRGSNPDSSKTNIEHLLRTEIKKPKIKKKGPGIAHLKSNFGKNRKLKMTLKRCHAKNLYPQEELGSKLCCDLNI